MGMTLEDETLDQFIERVEKAHFRTVSDTGANPNAMTIWNMVRKFAGLPVITKADLPSWCRCCRSYHVRDSERL